MSEPSDLDLTISAKHRYIVNFDTENLPKIETDFLVIGSGSAGLRAAIEANKYGDVLLVTKSSLRESNSRYAQGGIAVAMNVDDTVGFHLEDTLKAGAGLCDPKAVQVMVEEGIERVSELIDWGANFDNIDGKLGFTMEAAHSRRRIVHRGDATGVATTEVLVDRLLAQERIEVIENCFVVDLLTDDGICFGATVLLDGLHQLSAIFAKTVILATGGLGQIYRQTSNPKIATGDGFAIAWRAGCEMTAMEFVQFHPTTLFFPSAPNFLISEAVRGEGGILINSQGEAFMQNYHEMGDLAPRDVVSRAIVNEMQITGRPNVYLDLTHLPVDFIKKRFFTIDEICQKYGIEISSDLIPVTPAAHFMMGGVRTNLDAESNVKGLYACGEVACTGVHGSNRLASNSLLECLVWGVRAARSAAQYLEVSENRRTEIRSAEKSELTEDLDFDLLRSKLSEAMWKNVGILRNNDELSELLQFLSELEPDRLPGKIEAFEFQNMLTVAKLISEASIHRQESRGAHYRSDFPERNDRNWRRNIIMRNPKQ